MTVEALTLLYREAVNALSDRMCIDGSDEFCDKALKPGDIFASAQSVGMVICRAGN